jgi:hypothetical protein
LTAATAHENGCPVLKPPTVIGDPGPDFVNTSPFRPSVHVTWNDVIALPFAVPAVNDTTTGPAAPTALPDTAFTPVGTPGGLRGTTTADTGDAGPVPIPFVAVTLHVYDFPFVTPVTVIGENV